MHGASWVRSFNEGTEPQSIREIRYVYVTSGTQQFAAAAAAGSTRMMDGRPSRCWPAGSELVDFWTWRGELELLIVGWFGT